MATEKDIADLYGLPVDINILDQPTYRYTEPFNADIKLVDNPLGLLLTHIPNASYLKASKSGPVDFGGFSTLRPRDVDPALKDRAIEEQYPGSVVLGTNSYISAGSYNKISNAGESVDSMIAESAVAAIDPVLRQIHYGAKFSLSVEYVKGGALRKVLNKNVEEHNMIRFKIQIDDKMAFGVDGKSRSIYTLNGEERANDWTNNVLRMMTANFLKGKVDVAIYDSAHQHRITIHRKLQKSKALNVHLHLQSDQVEVGEIKSGTGNCIYELFKQNNDDAKQKLFCKFTQRGTFSTSKTVDVIMTVNSKEKKIAKLKPEGDLIFDEICFTNSLLNVQDKTLILAAALLISIQKSRHS